MAAEDPAAVEVVIREEVMTEVDMTVDTTVDRIRHLEEGAIVEVTEADPEAMPRIELDRRWITGG